MIIKKLTFTNFFRFYGKQSVFFNTQDHKNVTVIIGENGMGKSTILNSFYWAFYGDVTEPFSEEELLNKRARRELGLNKATEVSVEVEFSDRKMDYVLNRKQRLIKRSDGIQKAGASELLISYSDSTTGNFQPVSDPSDFFEKIIPQKLRGFFFFDGERIDRLAKIDGKDEIRKAILDVLGLTDLENIRKDLEEVKEEYLKDMKKHMKADESGLMDQYEACQAEEKKYEESIEQEKQNRQKAEAVLRDVDTFLQTHNSSVVSAKQEERKTLEEEIKKSEQNLETKRKDVLLHISRNFKTFWVSSLHSEVTNLLEEKRKKGELPSDIKAQFIKDLLERKRCICGNELIPGSDSAGNLKKLMEVAGRSELDDAYARLTAYIDFSKSESLNFYPTYFKLLDECKHYQETIDEKKEKLKAISEFLKTVPGEKIHEYEELREKTQKDISHIDRNIGAQAISLTNAQRSVEKLRIKIKQASLSNEQAQIFQHRAGFVEELGALNNEIRLFFIDSTRRNLDKKLKEVFGKMATKDYRQPVLTENFELGIVNVANQDEKVQTLSTGEGQITSLSFIGSLVSYAREKQQMNMISDFGGGDFPIVMDSPFGNLDSNHTANVAKGIGELASQVIVIVSSKQWSREVSDNIMGRVGKLYKIIDGDFQNDGTGEYSKVKEERI